jgi:hypothetical protein
MTTVILTTTVSVQDKVYLFQTDKNERINVYITKIKKWLYETELQIVVVENTGYTFEELNIEKEIFKNRFEVISFIEDNLEDAIFLRGNPYKGASEMFSIEYAFNNSTLCKTSDFIIKITGRFFIPLLESYLKNINLQSYEVLIQNNTSRCEMIGCNKDIFYIVFNRDLIDNTGKYSGNVEDVYEYRCNFFNKKIHCPEFIIEGTQRGGINEVFYTI